MKLHFNYNPWQFLVILRYFFNNKSKFIVGTYDTNKKISNIYIHSMRAWCVLKKIQFSALLIETLLHEFYHQHRREITGPLMARDLAQEEKMARKFTDKLITRALRKWTIKD